MIASETIHLRDVPTYSADEPMPFVEVRTPRSQLMLDVLLGKSRQPAKDTASSLSAIALIHEFRGLMADVRDGAEPRDALHGIVAWGPIGVPRLSGYLGRTVPEVKTQVQDLLEKEVIVISPETERGDMTYDVNASILGES